MSLSQKAVVNAQREAGLLQDLITSEGHDFELASWDWPYYSDKLKQQLYSFDETELMVYLEMNNILEKGVFYAAHQVYGVSFKERFDLPVYQEDVRVFDVIDADGTMLGMFIFDPYARANKRGGAWMNSYAPQSTLLGTLPIVANHLNVTKPSSGEATLLTFDEVTTMFHEFGHALHGLLSNVYYPSLSGTAVPRDFVEYPSQVNEMWSTWPEVLQNYATHYLTGETMPAELLNKVIDSEQFNQGYATVEYLAASVIDMELHQLSVGQLPTAKELAEFEVRSINKYGLNLNMVPPRYKSVYFSHIMGGYSAGYYAYIWSEVLDADTVAWFNDGEGSLRGKGDHLRSSVLSRGNTQEVMSLYYEFRGRDADVNYLLKRRGLN
jgi:peptidyl-dipeptidase Dcp